MIARYTLKEMEKIWTKENRYAIWLKVELAVCRAWNKLGRISNQMLNEIENYASFEVASINKIEKKVKHDVIAFLTDLTKRVGPLSRFIHLGLTSSDILDTAYAIQLRDSADLIINILDQLLFVLKKQALKYKYTLMIGRSHGIHAEPITFGVKLAGFYAEFKRDKERLVRVKDMVSRGKISGAVGTYVYLPPELEIIVMEELGLTPAIASTQVVARDGIAEYFCALGVLGGSIERLAVEIRHLQRTEVQELEEPFNLGQKGSSAMPHKKNPIVSENLTGQARLLRSYAIAAMENMVLWHERDISHSSVERIIGPDANMLAYYSLHNLCNLIQKLVINPKRMFENLNQTNGLIYSQQVLLALIENGVSREYAYYLVQKNAMASLKNNGNFKKYLQKDDEIVAKLGGVNAKENLNIFFDPNFYLKNVNYIFKKIIDE